VRFSDQPVESVSSDDICRFLEECTEGLSRSTRHLRYAQMKAFFNYVIEATTRRWTDKGDINHDHCLGLITLTAG
jgi:site-specific recombinase XerD